MKLTLTSKHARLLLILVLLLAAFLFRLGFGLALPFWPGDSLQAYLVGLKCFTTGTWPFFGPDLGGDETTHYNQIPGALEGLVVALPLKIWPIPEAPFIFLNLITLVAIALFAWYCSKRLPRLPLAFIFILLVVLPWTLHENTGMITRAWCLFSSILFFIGFFESLPGFSLKILSPRQSNALMGFAFLWQAQFHMSWIYLGAFFGLSLIFQWKEKPASVPPALLFFLLGSLPMAALILPTLIKYGGIPSGNNSESYTTLFCFENFKQGLTILARWLSLASYEMPFFLDTPGVHGFDNWGSASGPHWAGWAWLPSFQPGHSTHARLEFLMGSPFLLYPGIFLWIAGLFQALGLLVMGFIPKHESKDWNLVRGLALLTFVMVWASFWFTYKWPLSHIYYDATFPLVFLYSLYCWNTLAASKAWRVFGVVFLMAAIVFQTAYAYRIYPVYSIYMDRDKIVRAIHEKNYHWVGERRPSGYY